MKNFYLHVEEIRFVIEIMCYVKDADVSSYFKQCNLFCSVFPVVTYYPLNIEIYLIYTV